MSSFFSTANLPYIIGEIGFNHNGDPDTAHEMIRQLAEAGADCAKLQLFRTDHLLSAHVDQDVIETFRAHELSREEYQECLKIANERDIQLAASIFDLDTLQWYIEETDPPFIKIASGDLTFKRLVTDAGNSEIPVILSVGGGTLKEIKRAIEWLEPNKETLTLLHCVPRYPADESELHLRRIQTLTDQFDFPVGFSDHSESSNAPRIASALGAVAWERHVTLDSTQKGPEHGFSMEIQELSKQIPKVKQAFENKPSESIQKAETILGEADIKLTDADRTFRKETRRSLMAEQPIPAGSILEEKLIRELRPGTGLPAGRIDDCLKLPVPRPVEPLHMIPY